MENFKQLTRGKFCPSTLLVTLNMNYLGKIADILSFHLLIFQCVSNKGFFLKKKPTHNNMLYS